MKKKRPITSMTGTFILFLAFTAPFGLQAVAAEPPSMERGMKLFNDADLGSNSRSCAICHPDDKKLQGVSDLDDEELAAVINRCITKALKGKGLDPSSYEMKSPTLYLRYLASEGSVNKEKDSIP